MMRRLNQRELEDLVRWFTRHMSQETRVQLMGELPVHYKLLFPSVSDELLSARVIERIREVGKQADPLPHLPSL